MVPRPPTRTASVAERAAAGRAARKIRPRSSIGEFVPSPTRADPVQLLAAQEADRIPELLPLRHQRMSVNPFAFLRGAAAIMAADLGAMPTSGLTVQLCGDAHMSNLGLFAGPDRSLVFDLNDFDETNPGPFEWDVQRLATSFQVAAHTAGHKEKFAQELPRAVAEAYRTGVRKFSGMNDLDLWYYRIDASMLTTWAQEAGSKAGERAIRKTTAAAAAKDRWSAVKSLTTMVDGHRRFKDQPPLLTSIPTDDSSRQMIQAMYEEYRERLLIDRAELLSRYHWVDAGHKVVGVGSVGLLAFVLLLQGRDEDDLLVLQIKQAVASVLEPYTSTSVYPSHGQRVVSGQRIIQAATDAFLGYTDGPERSYYVRQLRDMKWSPDPLEMTPEAYSTYAGLCGAALARAHCRSGDSVALAAYLGSGDTFDRAIQEFSNAYTQQNERDYHAYMQAIANHIVSMPDGAFSAQIQLRSTKDGSVQVEGAS